MAIVNYHFLTNMTDGPIIDEASIESKLLAEATDALMNWSSDDEEEGETWDYQTIQDGLFGRDNKVESVILETDTNELTMTLNDGRQFIFTCREVK